MRRLPAAEVAVASVLSVLATTLVAAAVWRVVQFGMYLQAGIPGVLVPDKLFAARRLSVSRDRGRPISTSVDQGLGRPRRRMSVSTRSGARWGQLVLRTRMLRTRCLRQWQATSCTSHYCLLRRTCRSCGHVNTPRQRPSQLSGRTQSNARPP